MLALLLGGKPLQLSRRWSILCNGAAGIRLCGGGLWSELGPGGDEVPSVVASEVVISQAPKCASQQFFQRWRTDSPRKLSYEEVSENGTRGASQANDLLKRLQVQHPKVLDHNTFKGGAQSPSRELSCSDISSQMKVDLNALKTS